MYILLNYILFKIHEVPRGSIYKLELLENRLPSQNIPLLDLFLSLSHPNETNVTASQGAWFYQMFPAGSPTENFHSQTQGQCNTWYF